MASECVLKATGSLGQPLFCSMLHLHGSAYLYLVLDVT